MKTLSARTVFILLALAAGSADSAPAQLKTVLIVPQNERFICTPTAVWDGDGPIWCAEGPHVRLQGIAAREIDGSCRDAQPCPVASGVAARDVLFGGLPASGMFFRLESKQLPCILSLALRDCTGWAADAFNSGKFAMAPRSLDAMVLEAASVPGAVLVTLVGIDGSFSRPIGSQLAVAPDGAVVGDLTGGCLEKAFVAEAATAREARTIHRQRFGQGSPYIDLPLPCGGGLDLVFDPNPDRALLADAIDRLDARKEVTLVLHGLVRRYVPPLRLLLFGDGPEPTLLAKVASAAGYAVDWRGPARGGSARLFLGQVPAPWPSDRWTANITMFHDHEWEIPLLVASLQHPALMVGAMGSRAVHSERVGKLTKLGISLADMARISAPVGLVHGLRDPAALAISVLAEAVACWRDANS